MATFLLIALWIVYTIACFVIYHKLVKVYYIGSMFDGVVREILTCLIISSLLSAATVLFWWITVIILIIVTIILRGKFKDVNSKKAFTILMVVLMVIIAIAGIQLTKNSKNTVSGNGNITDDGMFMTTEELEAYQAENALQENAEQEYEQYLENVDDYVIECNGDTPLDNLDGVLTKRQVVELLGMSEDNEDFFTGYYSQVIYRDLIGTYDIDYDRNGVIESVTWRCESSDIEKSTEVINELISYYQGIYGDYEKMIDESHQSVLYYWDGPYSVEVETSNNSIYFAVGSLYSSYDGRVNFKKGEAWYRRSDGLLLYPSVDEYSWCEVTFSRGDSYRGTINECMLGSADILYYDGTSSFTSDNREYPGLVLEIKIQGDNNHLSVQQTGTIPDYPDIDLTGEYTFDENAWLADIEIMNDFENYDTTASSELYSNESNDPAFIFPYSSDEYLSMKEIEGLSAEECKIARNEIYARHGRLFTDEDLQAYFDSCYWYDGSIAPENFDDDSLSDIEKANRDLIIEYEKEMGYRE